MASQTWVYKTLEVVAVAGQMNVAGEDGIAPDAGSTWKVRPFRDALTELGLQGWELEAACTGQLPPASSSVGPVQTVQVFVFKQPA